jgi:hypothetical protein
MQHLGLFLFIFGMLILYVAAGNMPKSSDKIAKLEKEIVQIKTVLYLKNILPEELYK